MVALNIFRWLGEFFTNVLFVPYKFFSSLDNWWISNTFNFILISAIGLLFVYWLAQLQKFKKTSTE